jgi:hypothetical protein
LGDVAAVCAEALGFPEEAFDDSALVRCELIEIPGNVDDGSKPLAAHECIVGFE